MDRALLHCDNVYAIPNLRCVGHICRTNVASHTAFRGFGGPQVLCSPVLRCVALHPLGVGCATRLPRMLLKDRCGRTTLMRVTPA